MGSSIRQLSAPSQALKDQTMLSRGFEAQGEAMRSMYDNSGTFAGRLKRAKSGGNLAAQSKFSAPATSGPGGFAAALADTVRRGKARQGIIDRGENAVRNQALKDRITAARSAFERRGVQSKAAADAAQIKVGNQAAVRQARHTVRSAETGLIGGILGAGANGLMGMFGGLDKLGQGMLEQQGQVDEFLGADEGWGGFDFDSESVYS